jgi:hypothetical protein
MCKENKLFQKMIFICVLELFMDHTRVLKFNRIIYPVIYFQVLPSMNIYRYQINKEIIEKK